MSIFERVKQIFTPVSYQSVEEYAGDANIDLLELKASTLSVFQESGKVEAIKHVNRTVSPKKPIPLSSTYRFVNKLTESQVVRN